MSSIVVAGDTSGSVTISAPAVAGTPTLTLPTTSGTILTSGTAVTAAQGGTGLTSVGTSGNVLTSNGTAWVSSAPAASGPVLKLITDSTDIALADIASSYSTIGSSFSISIPTTGIIRIASFAGRLVNTGGSDAANFTLGIRIGSTNYWLGYNQRSYSSVTTNYYPSISGNTSVLNDYCNFYGAATTVAGIAVQYYNNQSPMCSDIAANSIPTGTQTVQLIGALYKAPAVGTGTLKGTVVTTKFGIEFVSAS